MLGCWSAFHYITRTSLSASLCIFWTVWKERNKRCLEDVVQMDQVLKSSFLCLLLDWVRVDLNEATMSMIDLINWLGVCRFFFFSFCLFFAFILLLTLMPLHMTCICWRIFLWCS